MEVPFDDDLAPLIPVLEQLKDCVLGAHKEQLGAFKPETRAKTRKRVISGLMNDIVTFNMRRSLTGQSGIQISDTHGQLKVILSSKYLMKAKKRDERNRMSYTPTQLALNFVFQMEQLQLEGMPVPLTSVILSYWWNKARTEIVKVSIIWPNGRNSYSRELVIPLVSAPKLPALEVAGNVAESALLPKPVMPKQKAMKKRTNKKVKKFIQGQERNEQQGESR